MIAEVRPADGRSGVIRLCGAHHQRPHKQLDVLQMADECPQRVDDRCGSLDLTADTLKAVPQLTAGLAGQPAVRHQGLGARPDPGEKLPAAASGWPNSWAMAIAMSPIAL
ncbi:hypothetical protein [Nonomuraea sp. NPDC049480]|uniref:hypothetical protein n=1 Tax=Nonomuraea sp. NPDC049480 TaxID=3364353 RepID=UPI003790041E